MKENLPLTPREAEILQLVLAGKTNKAIAKEIHISIKTVEFHLHHIYTKAGGRSRMAAVFWAFQHGMDSDSHFRSNPSRHSAGSPSQEQL